MADDDFLTLYTPHSLATKAGTLLEAVEIAPAPQRQVMLFFSHDTSLDQIELAADLSESSRQTVSGAPRIVALGGDGAMELRIAGVRVNVEPQRADPGQMAGRNVGLAIRNGESVETVMDWLIFHAKTQGMTGAVLISRGQPAKGRFARLLRKELAKRRADFPVVLVQFAHPLGRKDLPAEAHPFTVPDAPGKDRMKVPDADPWRSPLAEALIYEWAQRRFLQQARSVANIEIHDLLVPDKGPTVFEQAVAAPGGYISLEGQLCYPWRLRKDTTTKFADHTCVQFDGQSRIRRWCIAPDKLRENSVLRPNRVGRLTPDDVRSPGFYRCMALRHPSDGVSQIVAKTSLIEHPPLMQLMNKAFDHKPIRTPVVRVSDKSNGRRTIITTMKNEGPFILEWIAYHRVIGIDDFLIYSNDCTDGTDCLLETLQDKGIVQHRDNPYRQSDLKPQHAALQAAEDEPIVSEAEWLVCMDVDEYINIKTGDGTLGALFSELGDRVNMIAMTWRLFGNQDIRAFEDGFITRQFSSCAPELVRKPHQAWGFKTMFRNIGIFKKLGVHRPKGLRPQLLHQIDWVNGSGRPMPKNVFRNGWRSTTQTYGYNLVQLNHYAVRSAESFLVKRDRGRVNHVDRDQGLAYWFRMNNNAVEDTSIQRIMPRLNVEMDRLLADPDIAAAHQSSVQAHRDRIKSLRATVNYENLYKELTSSKLEKLSRLHRHFGANVFLQGPESVPDHILSQVLEEDFFFTVEKGETSH